MNFSDEQNFLDKFFISRIFVDDNFGKIDKNEKLR